MPVSYPPYIFGMHDRGGEPLMLQKDRRGWVLVTEALGADPNNHSGGDYTDLSSQGLGVIARLNHGYGSAGTIPYSNQYADFARRVGNFVAASRGCRIWIIGNEMNLANERPGGPGGQVITPQLYADCFGRCRSEIRGRAGHRDDQVIVGAVGPWNTETRYAGNLRGDWVQYFADLLTLLGDATDGMALHTYTHGQDPDLVFSDAKMAPPFQDYHYHFYAYRDFMAAIPLGLRDRPVYITEADQYDAWRDQNSGWVRNAYREIDGWNRNQDHQPIQALVLFRWIIGNPNDAQQVGWAIENKPGVQDDFRSAMDNPYTVVLPKIQPEYLAAWLEVAAPGWLDVGAATNARVTVRNDGRRTWSNRGSGAVRLGYRWLDAAGAATEGARVDLPHSAAPGETVTLPAVALRAPDKPGFYTLQLDLVEGAATWFDQLGSPPWRAEAYRVGPLYRVAWLEVGAPTGGTAGETISFPVRVRNEGALTWPPGGKNPVSLSYRWLDADRNVVVVDGLRTPIGGEVSPLGEIALDARLQFPNEPGAYILQVDMVHEFATWFGWEGSPVYEVQVSVEPAIPDYAAEWIGYAGPERVVVGQRGSAFVEVRNSGRQSWPDTGDDAVCLGYRWFDGQDNEVPVDGVQTYRPADDIGPGEVATFRGVEFVLPGEPGSYRLVWDLKQGEVWLSANGVAVLERSVQAVAPEYGVVWHVLQPWPARIMPGQEQWIGLRLVNIGTRTWSSSDDHPVQLAYNWFTEDGQLAEPWETFRIPLPQDVPTGEAVDLFQVPFRVPSVLGNNVLRWDLVEEGLTWFFRQGGAPLEMRVEVTDRPMLVPWSAQAGHNPDGAPLAFDGVATTFWDSLDAQEPGMWFEVDLQKEMVLDRIRVSSPGRGFPVGYQVKLSADRQEWHLVAEQARNWSDLDLAFAPCRARYLRLEQSGQPDWQASWMISEIAVSATEPWAVADASHYAADADRAWDASVQTYWNTRSVKQKPGMWFQLDMGRLRAIERVTLENPQDQQPRGYVVLISADGQDWLEVGRKEDNWDRVDVQFPTASARYVRVELINSSTYHPWGIAEFAVWRSSPVWGHGRQL